MSVTDIMAPSEGISPKWTQFPSGKRWKLKNFKEKYVQKSVKSCNYPVFLYSKKRFCCRPPKKHAIIRRAIIRRLLYNNELNVTLK